MGCCNYAALNINFEERMCTIPRPFVLATKATGRAFDSHVPFVAYLTLSRLTGLLYKDKLDILDELRQLDLVWTNSYHDMPSMSRSECC